MHDFASHPAAIMTDGSFSVFAKMSGAKNGLDQFEVELAGLQTLHDLAGVRIPQLIDIIQSDIGVVLLMEALQQVDRGPNQWRDIGRTLARIHQIKDDMSGFGRQGYFGPLCQDNRPIKDWLSFFIERRLRPWFVGAVDCGRLSTQLIRNIDKLINLLPEMDIPDTQPALLHGDAQQNNFISTVDGTVVIDPAVSYGNPEYDLALVDYFQEVPSDLFEGYQEIAPIDPGFEQRRELWRISAYLAVVQVDGTYFMDKLEKAVQLYI